jgi:hypothetical protein
MSTTPAGCYSRIMGSNALRVMMLESFSHSFGILQDWVRKKFKNKKNYIVRKLKRI